MTIDQSNLFFGDLDFSVVVVTDALLHKFVEQHVFAMPTHMPKGHV